MPRKRLAFCITLVKVTLAVVLAASSVLTLQAQPAPSGDCGTALAPEMVARAFQQHQQLLSLGAPRSTTHYRVPVQMHIVRQNDATGGFNPAEMAMVMSAANVHFAQVNIEIYEYKSANFINSDYFYFDCTSSAQWDSLKRTDAEPEAINIYWVPNESGFPYCGISSFSGSGTQGIIMNNLCGGSAQPFNSTVVHEIGHYFDLYHTHETAFGVECPSGSNCSSTGDLLCDTPADPDLYGHVSPAPECLYDNYASTPAECDATPYAPQTDNIMSYSTKACEDLFTPQQIDKFRLVLETVRTELATLAGSILYRPREISPLLAMPGTIADTTIRLTNIGTESMTILSAIAMAGRVQVTGPTPINLGPGASQDYIISYDASGASGACDVGQILDEIRFQTSDPELPEKFIPVAVNVVYAQPTTSSNTFGPDCLRFTVPNTPALGNQASEALYGSLLENVLYDASLLIGTVDGSDTVVYQDNYSQEDFAVVDGFTENADIYGRTLQKLRFATKDGRIHGDVTYSYGWNTSGADSCAQIVAVYKLRNPCDTSLTVAVGVFADFDLDDFTFNDGAVNSGIGAVQVAFTFDPDRVVALASLAPASPALILRVISNQELVYPTSSLPDRTAYREMVSSNSDSYDAQDVSALLSFGKRTLPHDGEITIPVAFLLSNTGTAPFAQVITKLKSMLSSGTAGCGDADGTGVVTISDAVFLISYIFMGGPAPSPISAGDVDCNEIITISDIVYLVHYIFMGGPVPCAGC